MTGASPAGSLSTWECAGKCSLRLPKSANRAANLPDITSGKIVIAGQNGVGATAGVDTDWHSFAPRFGFAATVAPRTVLRGGFGISFWPPNTGTGSNSVFRDPPFTSVLVANQQRQSVGFTRPAGPPATDPNNPTGTIYNVANNITNPYVEQFNLTLQRELFAGLVFNVGYVGAMSRHVVFNYNARSGASRTGRNQAAPSLFRPDAERIGNSDRVNSTGNQEYQFFADRVSSIASAKDSAWPQITLGPTT